MLLLTKLLSKVARVLFVTSVCPLIWGWWKVLYRSLVPRSLCKNLQKWVRNFVSRLDIMLLGIPWSLTTNELSHLWEMVHHHHDGILTLLSPWKSSLWSPNVSWRDWMKTQARIQVLMVFTKLNSSEANMNPWDNQQRRIVPNLCFTKLYFGVLMYVRVEWRLEWIEDRIQVRKTISSRFVKLKFQFVP